MKKLFIAAALLLTACEPAPNWKYQENKRIDHTYAFVYTKGKEFGITVRCSREVDIRFVTVNHVHSNLKIRFGTSRVETLEGKKTAADTTQITSRWVLTNLRYYDEVTLQFEPVLGYTVTETLNISGLEDALEKNCG